MKAVIIDDEEDARIVLRQMLERYCPAITSIYLGDAVNSGLKIIQQEKPDVVFLDVELQPGSGFDLLSKIHEINFEIIFTTAHEHYALNAIRCSAFAYLLKPIDIDELTAVVNKLNKKIIPSVAELKQFILSLNTPRKLCIHTTDGILYIEPDEIIRCEADVNYTHFFLASGKVTVPRTLKEYDELLKGHNFIRIHKSHLVNIKYIRKYIKSSESLEMSDGAVIDISARKKAEVLHLLANSI